MTHASRIACALLLTLTACGDDDTDRTDVTEMDMAVAMDLSMPMVDASDGDLGTDPSCTAETCVNGTCEADACVCDAGWSGESCAGLDEPTTDGVLLWFDADMPDTLTIGESNRIDAWEARFAVGGGATVTPPSDGQRPSFQPGTSTWGHGAIGFDGVDDKLVQEGLWPGLAGRTEYTVFGVYTHGMTDTSAFTMTDPDGNPGFGLGTGPLSRQMMCLYADANGGDTGLLETERDAVPTSGIQVVVLRVTEGGATMRFNGAQVDRSSTAVTLDLPASEIVFGAESVDGDERVYPGAIGEVIVYGSALGDTALAEVEDYLLAKWRSM
jgi:hypothetical protein